MPENDERPVTLASLRGKPVRLRPRPSGSPSARPEPRDQDESGTAAPQMGLLFSEGADETTTSLVAAPLPIPVQPLPRVPDRRVPRHLQKDEAATAMEAPWGRPATRDLDAGAVREKRVWTVRGIVADVRGRLEGGYGEVWVEGEISNCRPAASGHLYLTLKDGEAQLPVVLFRRQAQLLRFRPSTGMAVLVRGRLSVYEGRGELQLIGEVLEPRGTGALLVAFEQLKVRLAEEGLFETSRKRALPSFPKCVGVITSTSGAVLHDIVTVVRRRHARLNLLVYPALVQGPGCAASVAAGVRWFNRNPEHVEMIVVARGGGAPEDLAGFNDEALARAIAESVLPVISAVGHETDFTIADFVADLRAPTPSAAAEIMTQSQHKIEERLEALERRLKRASRYRLLEARQRFARMSTDHVLRQVRGGLDRRQQRVDALEGRMLRATERAAAGRLRQMELLQGRLERQNVVTHLLWGVDRLARLEDRLRQAAPRVVANRAGRLDRVTGRLQALSPLAVLSRGYALLYTVDGGNVGGTSGAVGFLITSSTDTMPGQRVHARLAKGSVTAQVTETDPT